MMSISVTNFLFILTALVCSSSAEKCDASDSDNQCYNLEEWRQNILCRMQGGVGNNPRQNGYLSWALNHQSSDTSSIRSTRYNAMKFFIKVQQELKISYGRARPRDRLSYLQKYEREMNDWGNRLANIDPNESWTSTRCGLSISGYSVDTPCGERVSNPPSCLIRQPGVPGR